ncbi:DEAD/DEAH box helicase [Luteipulveratus sp. YIM 133132]|uniref:DEAD/DEAH box helicase n=1 Tax=Luteipulveratus flavus TaxID=3031728 RepID=A0ABT6C4F9_9MICO|nr:MULTISPECIES: DEAD/DEAH box helicase [unclassified Luteipulveratus]MDE9367786.1 DEAD/DEAH box helicase [Luteipulveratus sp. YIM 133132]MDF8263708.1 DEAD/DEAH box helicase [Luteipulveratus sp. YIM 133296]
MSTSAASHLSPAFPERAAWGTASKLRAWQAEALERYLGEGPRDFLAVATPGAGKTTYALRVATELLGAGIVRQVTIVAPTEHLKTQWADAAARVGINIDPRFTNAQEVHAADYDGVAVTYAGVASRPALHRARTEAVPTLVILDEIHHGGDAKSWGDALREAFEPATRRLSLTGTPFRSDTSPIPFVRYAEDQAGIRRSASDYTYGYAEALRDGVVRPVLFMAYGGNMRWRTRAGDEIAARLGEPLTKDATGQAWRTALDPKGEWIPSVLRAADKRLSEVRRHVPDAGGLVIASNQTAARSYARTLEEISGDKPTVVLSDDAGSSSRIEEFAASEDRWMVAVRMVSEGVDVPRLAVGVYATSTSTPLFFAQAVGRFVRARRRGETASVFLPSVPQILEHASRMEDQRDHALDRPKKAGEEESIWAEEEGLLAEANRAETALADEQMSFEALESEAEFDHVLFDAQQFGMGAEVGSEDEQDYLGLPGLLEPDQVTQLLRQRQSKQVKAGRTRPETDAPMAAHRALAAQRKELNSLVAAYARKTGQPHATIHNDLRSTCGGPTLDRASTEQVTARIELIRKWFVGRR